MRLDKVGNGFAQSFADVANISITLQTIEKDESQRDRLLDSYLADYKQFNEAINDFLSEHLLNCKLNFDTYYNGTYTNRVEIVENNRTKYKDEFDHYYILANFSMEMPIVNNDRSVLAQFTMILDELSKHMYVRYHVTFDLSEQLRAKLSAEATNNALDNIKIEVMRIASHLGFNNVTLMQIDFVSQQTRYASNLDMIEKQSKFSASSMTPAEKVQLLEDMLQSKEIKVYSNFISVWEIK